MVEKKRKPLLIGYEGLRVVVVVVVVVVGCEW